MEEKLKKILEHYGPEFQKYKALEELTELQLAIIDDIKDEGNLEHTIEEMADVYVMCRQLMMIYNITEENILEAASQKIHRQICRMENEDGRKKNVC